MSEHSQEILSFEFIDRQPQLLMFAHAMNNEPARTVFSRHSLVSVRHFEFLDVPLEESQGLRMYRHNAFPQVFEWTAMQYAARHELTIVAADARPEDITVTAFDNCDASEQIETGEFRYADESFLVYRHRLHVPFMAGQLTLLLDQKA